MKQSTSLFIIVLLFFSSLFISPITPITITESESGTQVLVPPDSYSKVDISHARDGHFTQNLGQIGNDDVRYFVTGSGLWFLDDSIVLDVREPINREVVDDPFLEVEDIEPVRVNGVVLKLYFIGCNEVVPEGREMFPHQSNFFYGNDSLNWRSNVPNFGEIYYQNIYDNIDLRYYLNKNGLKYDFIVHPGGDVSDIRMRYEGADRLEIDQQGNLVVLNPIDPIIDKDLLIYQEQDLLKVEGRFQLTGNNEYGFDISGEHDENQALVIDPYIVFSTLIGGSDLDSMSSLSMDDNNNIILAGRCQSNDFPTTTGAYQTIDQNLEDAIVCKFNSDCSGLLFSTYIGGVGVDRCNAMSMDP